MGTPGFAVGSLRKLYQSQHDIVGVVTVPDKPQGRGQKLGVSSIKIEAEKLGIPVLQPDNLDEPTFLDDLAAWRADCFAVVAFRILPPAVFGMPPKGTVNLHASLLPKYRGAAPIQWALMNGELETGVTTFFIQKKVDTGDILLQKTVEIDDDMDAGGLHDALALAGADLLVQTMDGIAHGDLHPKQQDGDVTLAPKILQHHCQIDWNQSAVGIRNQIRALSPRPGAFSQLHLQRIKIFNASLYQECLTGNPGQIVLLNKHEMVVATGNGCLSLEVVQIQGKRKMSIADFLRGYAVTSNEFLGE